MKRIPLLIVLVFLVVLVIGCFWVGVPFFIEGSYHPTIINSAEATVDFRDGEVSITDATGRTHLGTYSLDGWSVRIQLEDAPGPLTMWARSTPLGLIPAGKTVDEMMDNKGFLFRRKLPWDAP
jgi:hypothetical protein